MPKTKPPNPVRSPDVALEANEFDVANSVKWAIESATRLPCIYRGGELLAEATPSTAKRLAEIAAHITHSFRALLHQFSVVDGVGVSDRAAFVMGLYDGMMNEVRHIGQQATTGKNAQGKKTRRTRGHRPSYPSVHRRRQPRKQIRFSAPLEQIAAELQAVTQRHLARGEGQIRDAKL